MSNEIYFQFSREHFCFTNYSSRMQLYFFQYGFTYLQKGRRLLTYKRLEHGKRLLLCRECRHFWLLLLYVLHLRCDLPLLKNQDAFLFIVSELLRILQDRAESCRFQQRHSQKRSILHFVTSTNGTVLASTTCLKKYYYLNKMRLISFKQNQYDKSEIFSSQTS